MNDSTAAVNTAKATVSYNYKDAEKTIDFGNFSLYAASLQIKNTDASGNAASGSKFALYKEKVVYSGNIGKPKFYKITEGTSIDSLVSFKGLSEGRYKLKQVAVPAGYEPMSDIIFNVSMAAKDGNITSLAVKDDFGENLPWTVDAGNGIISAEMENKIDETLTKDIYAEVKYSYDENIETSYTEELKSTVHILEEDGEINTSGISGKNKAGYKLDRITINGSEIDELPEYVHDGDLIIYHYVKDMDLKKTLRATVRYYKDNVFDSSASYSREVGYFEAMLPTDGISDKADSFQGYKLSKITVDGKEVQSLPEEVKESAVICFYYVADDGQTKTLTASVQHILVDYNTKAEKIQGEDTFTYSKEVRVVDSGTIDASEIPVKDL